MNLYIEIENGQPKNHPAFRYNLIQAFGSVPEHWEPFVRVEKPSITMYQVIDPSMAEYKKVDGVWTDVWTVRDMTNEERLKLQQEIKDAWALLPDRDNFSAWVFDASTSSYQPPIPRPVLGDYFWQGTTGAWVTRPEYPIDGKKYKLDYASASYVEITQE
jgi:hypothetical protein